MLVGLAVATCARQVLALAPPRRGPLRGCKVGIKRDGSESLATTRRVDLAHFRSDGINGGPQTRKCSAMRDEDACLAVSLSNSCRAFSGNASCSRFLILQGMKAPSVRGGQQSTSTMLRHTAHRLAPRLTSVAPACSCADAGVRSLHSTASRGTPCRPALHLGIFCRRHVRTIDRLIPFSASSARPARHPLLPSWPI